MLLLMILPGVVIVVVIVSPSRSAPSGGEGFMEIDKVSALSLTVTSSWGTFEVALHRRCPPGDVISSTRAFSAKRPKPAKYRFRLSQFLFKVRIESVVSSNTISVYWLPSALNSTFASIRQPVKHARHTPNATTAPRRRSLFWASEAPRRRRHVPARTDELQPGNCLTTMPSLLPNNQHRSFKLYQQV